MDVIWTAEFAAAGWVLPWQADTAEQVRAGRLASAVDSATYADTLWAAPFTSNTQLLWYRSDRMQNPPTTWDSMITRAEDLGEVGTIQAQGERYEGLTVFFVSLLASAEQGLPSRVTLGGINLGIGVHSRHPDLAFEAAACLAAEPNQRLAATRGGLPPTLAALYDDAAVRETFPFAETLRAARVNGANAWQR